MHGNEHAITRLFALSPARVLMPQPVLAELRYGIFHLAHSRRRRRLDAELDKLLETVCRAERSDEVSARFGSLKAELDAAGSWLEDSDVAIAAHALVLDAVLVSSNTRHMARVPGLRLEDWRTEG